MIITRLFSFGKRAHLAIYSMGVMFFLPLITSAEERTGPGAHIDNIEGIPKGSLPDFIQSIIQAALGLVGAVALAFFIYGGFIYITSGGDEKQIARGKQVMIYAVLGILAIGFSYVIVNFVISELGGGAGAGG